MTPLAGYLRGNAISCTALAREIGVKDSTVSRWARGLRKPTLRLAFAIERATLGCVPAASWQEGSDKRATRRKPRDRSTLGPQRTASNRGA